MSNWEQKRKELHRLIVRRSRMVSAVSFLVMALSVAIVVQMKKISENNENYKFEKLRQEILQKRK